MEAPPLNKILHVDDSPDILEIVNYCLAKAGTTELLLCGSGEEALEKAEAFAPDLMLLDSLMPTMTGIELHRLMGENPKLADIPTIFLTSEAETVNINSFLQAGAIDIISKPFDVSTLADTIEEIWREHWQGQP